MKLKLFLGFVLLVLVLVFALQNTTVIKLQFLGWAAEVSLALLIFLTFAAGIMVGGIGISLARQPSK